MRRIVNRFVPACRAQSGRFLAVVAVVLVWTIGWCDMPRLGRTSEVEKMRIGFEPEQVGNIYVEKGPAAIFVWVPVAAVRNGGDRLEITGIDFWGRGVLRIKRTLELKTLDEPLLFPVKIVRQGVYHTRVTLKNKKGVVLAEASSAFGIIPDVGLKQLRPASPFGIGSYFAVRFEAEALRKAAHLHALLGCAWNRDELLWDLCEPKEGEWHRERFDRTVAACHENDILILGLLDYWGKWAKPLTEEGYEAYGNYVKKVVARYKPGGAFAQEHGWRDGYGIRDWEIWNEPATFWGGTPEQFGRLLQVAYKSVKEADPEGQVFFSDAGETFDDRVLKTAGKDVFDGVTPHYYCPPKSPEDGKLDEQMRATVEFFRERGIKRPFWCSEMGWHSTDTVESQREQAQFLVRSMVIALASGIDKVFWYNFFNDSLNKSEEFYGLFNREDFTPKFGYAAYAGMIRFLESARYYGSVRPTRDVRCYVFEKGAGAWRAESWSSLGVVWSSGAEGTLAVASRKPLRLLDIFGNEICVKRGKHVRIPLRGDPIYVEGQGIPAKELEAMLEAGQVRGIASVDIALLPLIGPLAEKPPIRVRVSNSGKTVISGGWISLEVPKIWRLKAGKGAKLPPLQPNSSTVFSFESEELRRNDANKYEVTARLRTSAGQKAIAQKVLSELVAVKASPKIDGELSDWKSARWVYLDDASQAVGLAPWADFNISARVATAWDDANFYFAAEVTDNYFWQPYTGENVWEGDNFQIDFDCLNSKAKAEENKGFVEIGLSLTKKGAEVFKWAAGAGEPSGVVKEAELVVKPAGNNKYVYEARIPQSVLPLLELRAGTRFGFSFILNDNDGGGRRGWMEWTPGIGTGKNPSYFTEWTLVED
jgi:hypothetical protein